MTDPRAILLVQCPDRPGIVAAISSFLFRHGANITDFDQHTSDDGAGVYFTRLEFQTGKLDLPTYELGAKVATRHRTRNMEAEGRNVYT